MTLPPKLEAELTAHVTNRTRELLLDHAFYHKELVAIITSELSATIGKTVSDFVLPLLSTQEISVDKNMRYTLKK